MRLIKSSTILKPPGKEFAVTSNQICFENNGYRTSAEKYGFLRQILVVIWWQRHERPETGEMLEKWQKIPWWRRLAVLSRSESMAPHHEHVGKLGVK